MIDGWSHTLQSLIVLFTTRIGSRFMRRQVGSNVPRLFGENITSPTISRYILAITIATELWEPRFKIIRTDIIQIDNTPEQIRGGRFSLAIRGRYRPRALLGDFTVAPGERTIYVGQGTQAGQGVLVI